MKNGCVWGCVRQVGVYLQIRFFLFAFFLFFLLDANLFSLPKGGQAIHGEVIFSSPRENLGVIQASDNSIINYQSFNILSHESLQFVQPSGDSRVFNRVLGADPSLIEGNLSANGQVYLLNPSGVIFGPSSVINVGGIFAVAGSMSDQDFLARVNRFTDVKGAIINEGNIQGDIIHLIGESVVNSGRIFSDEGIISITSGKEVWLGYESGHIFVKMHAGGSNAKAGCGVENQGEIYSEKGSIFLGAGDIYAVSLRNEGKIKAKEIVLRSEGSGLVEVSGNLDSSGDLGGNIHIFGKRIEASEASINVSGKFGGGNILIGGDYQGSGGFPNADFLSVDGGSSLCADAFESGNGGKIIVWADDTTKFSGSAYARGGKLFGDGGFAEISGKRNLYFDGIVDLSAKFGKRGTLLLDPTNITIYNEDEETDDDGDLPDLSGSGGGDFKISEYALEGLSAGADIILEASSNITLKNLSDNLLDLQTNSGGSVTITADSDGNNNGDFIMEDSNDKIQTNNGNLIIAGDKIVLGSIDTGNNGDFSVRATDNIETKGSIASDKLTLEAEEEIKIENTLNTRGETIINADYDGDGSGKVIFDGAVDTNNNHLRIEGRDFEINAAIDSGSRDTSFTVTGGIDVDIGDSNGAPLVFGHSDLERITADDLTISTSGDIVVDDVSQNETDGIANRFFIESTGGSVSFSGNNSEFDPGVHASASTGIAVDKEVTTHGNTSFSTSSGTIDVKKDIDTTNSPLSFTAPDFEIDPPANISSGTANTSLNGTSGTDIRLVGSGAETNPFDLSNSTLERITANDLSIVASGSGTISVDGVTTTATQNVSDTFILQATNGDILFENNPSAFGTELEVSTRADIIIEENLTSDGYMELEADSNNNGSGDINISSDVSSSNNTLEIRGASFILTGTINSGSSSTTITASDNRDIRFGDSGAGLEISLTELGKISATGFSLKTENNADIYVNGITELSSANIGGTTSLDANGDVIYTGSASVFSGNLTSNPGGENKIGEDITTSNGSIVFNGDSVLTDDVVITSSSSGKDISFNGKVDSDNTSPKELLIDLGGTSDVYFNDEMGSSKPLKSIEVDGGEYSYFNAGSIETTEFQDYDNAIILKKDTSIKGGTITFRSTVDSDNNDLWDLSVETTDTLVFHAPVGFAASPLNSLDVLSVVAANALDFSQNIKCREASLHAGSDGSGDLMFSTNIDFYANKVGLRAGDGNGGVTSAKADAESNDPTFYSFDNAANSPSAFTIRQDASFSDTLAEEDMPATSQFAGGPSGMEITLISDDADIILDIGEKYAGSKLTLNGKTGVDSNDSMSLYSLDVTGSSTIDQDISASDSIVFHDDVVLTNDIAFSGGTITFEDTLDSDGTARDLSLNSSGIVSFEKDVGSISRLNTLETDGGGTTAINGSSVLSEGNQIYNDAVALGNAGDQRLDSSLGELEISSALSKANGNLTLGGETGIDINGDVNVSSGSLSIEDDFDASGNLVASANISLGGKATMSGGGEQRIDAQTGSLSSASEISKASGNLVLAGGTEIDFNAKVEALSGSLLVEDDFKSSDNIAASGGITFSGDGVFDGAGAQIVDAGSTVLTSNAMVKTTAGDLTLKGDSLIDCNGNVNVNSGNLIVEDPLQAQSDLTASGGISLNAAVNLDGTSDQVIDAGSGILQANYSLSKTTSGDLSLKGASKVDLDGDVSVSDGSLIVEDPLQAKSDLAASGGISLSDTVNLDGTSDQVIDAGSGTLQASSSLSKTASGDLTLKGTGNIDLNDDVDVDDGNLIIPHDFQASGNLIAKNNVQISGLGTLDGGGEQRIDAETGNLSVSSSITKATGNLAMGGGSSIDLDATITAAAGAITAEDSVKLSADLIAGNGVTLASDILLDGATNQSVDAGLGTLQVNKIEKTGAGNLTLEGNTLIDVEDIISVSDGNLLIDGPIDAEKDITSDNGSVSFNDQASLSGNITGVGINLGGTTTLDGAGDQSLDAKTGTLQADASVRKSSSGDLYLSGDAKIDLDDDLYVDNGTLFIQDSFESAGDVVTSGDLNINAGATFDGAGSQRIDSENGTLSVNSTINKANGDLTLAGATAIDINNAVNVNAGSLYIEDDFTASHDLTAGNDIRFSGTATLDGSGAQSVDAQNGVLTVASNIIKSSGDLELIGGSKIQLSGSGEQRIDAEGGSLNILDTLSKATGNLILGGATDIDLDATVTAAIGTLLIEDDFLAGGNLIAGGDITLQGSTTMDGSGDQSIDAGVGTLTSNVIAKTTAGNLTLGGDTLVDCNGDVNVNDGNLIVEDSFKVGKNLSASGGISLSGAVNLDGTSDQVIDAGSGTLQASSSLSKTASGDLTLKGTGNIDLNDDVDVDDGNLIIPHDFQASGNLIAKNNVQISGLGTLDGGGEQRIDAETGNLSVSSSITKATGNLAMGGGSSIDLDATITAAAGAITAEDSVKLSADLIAGNGVTLASDILLDGATNQSVDAGLGTLQVNKIEKTGAGNLTLEGNTLIDVEDIISVSDGNLLIDGPIDAEKDITSDNGSVSFNDQASLSGNITGVGINLGGTTTLDGAGDQSLDAKTGTLQADASVRKSSSGDLYLSGDAKIDLDDDLYVDNGTLFIQDSFESAGDVVTSGDLNINAGATFDGAGSQRIDSENGTLSVNSTINKANGDLTLAGATAIDINNAVNVNAGSLYIEDDFTASHDLTAGNDIRFSGTATLDGSGAQSVDAQSGALTVFSTISKGDGNLTLKGGTKVELYEKAETLSGSFTIEGDFDASGDLIANGDLTLLNVGTLSGSGEQRMDARGGTLTIESLLTKGNNNLILSGDSGIDINDDITVTAGDLIVEGSFTLAGDFLVSNDIILPFSGVLDGTGDQYITAQIGKLENTSTLEKSTEGGMNLSGKESILLNQSLIQSRGTQNFNGPTVLNDNVDLTADTVNFFSVIDGPYNLKISSSGDTTFYEPVGSITSLGTGTGPTVYIQAGGKTTFMKSVATESGIQQIGTAGTVTFHEDVTIQGGDTDSFFYGDVVFEGASFSTTGSVVFGDSSGDTLTLSGGVNSIDSSIGNHDIIINATINGAEDLSLLAGRGNVTVNAEIGTTTPIQNLISSGEVLSFKEKVDVSDAISLSASDSLHIIGSLDPITVSLFASDDIHIWSPVIADSSITAIAGSDGTGSVNLFSGSSLQTTDVDSRIEVRTGSILGDIYIEGDIRAGEKVSLYSPAGEITQKLGTIFSHTIDLDSSLGFSSLGNLSLSGSVISVEAGAGAISIRNSPVSDVSVSALSTNSGDISFIQSGGYSLSIDEAFTRNGNITIENSHGDIILVRDIKSDKEISTKGSGNMSISTLMSGNIYIGYVEAEGYEMGIVSAGDIQDAQDDILLDVKGEILSIYAEGDIGGDCLVGYEIDPLGNVEIWGTVERLLSLSDVTYVNNLKPSASSLLDPIVSIRAMPSPKKLGNSSDFVSYPEFLIGKAAYQSLSENFVGRKNIVPGSQPLEFLRFAGKILYQDYDEGYIFSRDSYYQKELFQSAAGEEELFDSFIDLEEHMKMLDIEFSYDISSLSLAWREIKNSIREELRFRDSFSLTESQILSENLKGEFEGESFSKEMQSISKLLLMARDLGLNREQLFSFKEELEELTRPEFIAKKEWEELLKKTIIDNGLKIKE